MIRLNRKFDALSVKEIFCKGSSYSRTGCKDKTMQINDLPPELIVHIFSFYVKSEGHRRFLKNIPRVCKRWNDLHSTPSLWNEIDFTPVRYFLRPWTWDQVKTLFEKGLLSSTQCLRLFNIASCSGKDITELIHHCHNLRELSTSNLSESAMNVLARQCPMIQKLNLLHVVHSKTHLEDLLSPFLKVRGQNLTHLKIACKDKNLVSMISKYCHSMEELSIVSKFYFPKVMLPIDEVIIGCPKLRNFCIENCKVDLSEIHDHEGFKNMVNFSATKIDFSGLDLYTVLESSKDLENLHIDDCRNVALRGLLKIPADKVKVLEIVDQNLANCPLNFLEDVVDKWRRSLITLRLRGMQRDMTTVIEAYLDENSDPKLELLDLNYSGFLKPHVLVKLMRVCKPFRYVHH